MSEIYNELELVNRAKEGDSRAFDKLMEHHYKFMYNVAARYTDFKEDTEEVVQEAMLKIWLNIDKFRGDSKLSTWIYIITANASKKNLTTRHKIPSHPWNQKLSYEEGKGIDKDNDSGDFIGHSYNDDQGMYGIHHDSPEDELITEQLGEAIFKLADELTDDLKDALYLREIELKSYEEISAELDIPLGTCKSRLFNARTILDDNLKAYFGYTSNKRFQIGS